MQVLIDFKRCEGNGFQTGSVSLAGFRGCPGRLAPRDGPRATLSAMGRCEGDAFRAGSVSLAGFRGMRGRRLP